MSSSSTSNTSAPRLSAARVIAVRERRGDPEPTLLADDHERDPSVQPAMTPFSGKVMG